MTTTSPTYFDLQVNGYGGVDFNQDDLRADDLHRTCERLAGEGVEILATIITEHVETMCRRLRRIVELVASDALARRVIRGFHIEGPFISATKGFYGAHPVDAVRPADVDTMSRLLDAGGGEVRLVTLAPEQDAGSKVTRFLADRKVVVSAGHTDASVDQLRSAIDAGLSMFTHLGNGCPMVLHRHDNIVQRALNLADRLWVCFIADGVHVPFIAMRNYMRLADPDKTIVVTDAMTAAGLGPGRFQMARWDVVIGEDMVARSPDGSHFLGAAITMAQSDKNLRERLGLTEQVCKRLLFENPRRAIGIG